MKHVKLDVAILFSFFKKWLLVVLLNSRSVEIKTEMDPMSHFRSSGQNTALCSMLTPSGQFVLFTKQYIYKTWLMKPEFQSLR